MSTRRIAMGRIQGVYLAPHPPIIVDEVGKGDREGARTTIDSMGILGREIKSKNPDTIIVISPHGPVFADGIGIMSEDILKGDFSRFGAPGVSMAFQTHGDLIERIIGEAQRIGILAIDLDRDMCSSYNISGTLDWGVLVPLYFVNQHFTGYRLVTMGVSQLPYHELYAFGIAMKRAIESQDKDVVIIASGDLSHRLKEDGPYGFHPAGVELDKTITSLIEEGDVEGLLTIDPELISEGGECGLRSIIMALGALDGQAFRPEVHSYEGPFGVGYCVASFEPEDADSSRNLMDKLIENSRRSIRDTREKEDDYVRLARESLETYVRTGETMDLGDRLPDSMLDNRAGTFVTIKQHGQLRGCIGTIEPSRESIAHEIVENAISAGTRDPRFFPVAEEELDSLVYSVDILMEPEPAEGFGDLDIKKYGVIVSHGSRSGLLLPNLEGISSPQEQVSIALQKAGIDPDEDYEMQRFEVKRHL
ncbi:MAG TPA: AmmeMemoRadiSam system protein A [Clostridia bacterium]|nr:AmmeMemoRadiSam system protein A [Clostridia bacterium]